MDKQLCEIAIAGESLKYCISFSYVLKYLGIVEKAHDLDIIIDLGDFDTFVKRFNFDTVNEIKPSKVYSSDKFACVKMSGVDIDIISNYKINYNGFYEYKFDYNRATEFIHTPCGKIPIIPLEDLNDLYSKMPKKNNNSELLNAYLNNKKL